MFPLHTQTLMYHHNLMTIQKNIKLKLIQFLLFSSTKFINMGKTIIMNSTILPQDLKDPITGGWFWFLSPCKPLSLPPKKNPTNFNRDAHRCSEIIYFVSVLYWHLRSQRMWACGYLAESVNKPKKNWTSLKRLSIIRFISMNNLFPKSIKS